MIVLFVSQVGFYMRFRLNKPLSLKCFAFSNFFSLSLAEKEVNELMEELFETVKGLNTNRNKLKPVIPHSLSLLFSSFMMSWQPMNKMRKVMKKMRNVMRRPMTIHNLMFLKPLGNTHTHLCFSLFTFQLAQINYFIFNNNN